MMIFHVNLRNLKELKYNYQRYKPEKPETHGSANLEMISLISQLQCK